MVLDMVNVFNNVTDAMWLSTKKASTVARLQDDTDGKATIRFLRAVKNIGTLVNDNGEHNGGSLGLDQAVYSYGVTGKFHPGAFLASLRLAQELKSNDKLKEFTKVRKEFEEFLVRHKIFINQISHSKGSRTRPVESMLQMHRIIIECLQNKIRDDKGIVRKLKRDSKLAELKDVTNIPTAATTKKRFSKSVEDAAVIRTLLENRERCHICGARLPPSCRSKDHKQRKAQQGTGALSNLQFTHPYCNTTYKN
jgi:hypothetical protein